MKYGIVTVLIVGVLWLIACLGVDRCINYKTEYRIGTVVQHEYIDPQYETTNTENKNIYMPGYYRTVVEYDGQQTVFDSKAIYDEFSIGDETTVVIYSEQLSNGQYEIISISIKSKNFQP